MGILFGTRSAWVPDVTADIRKLVVATGRFAQDAVFEYMNPIDLLTEEPTNDRQVAIFPGAFDANVGGMNDGSPNTMDVLDGLFSVDIVARISTGKPRRNAKELTEQTRGFGDLTKLVAKALHRKTFADANNSTYLFEPTRVVRVVFNSSKGQAEWNKATVVVSAKFRADLSQP